MMEAAARAAKTPLSVEYFRPPRFDFSNAEEAKAGCDYLKEHGYAVAKSVLTPSEITKAHGLFWDFMEGYPKRMETVWPGFAEEVGAGVDRNNPLTWSNWNWPGSHQNGIINDYGANQSPFAWFVRSRPKVKEVFAHVWETTDLLCSFDAVNAFRPWEFEPEWKTSGGWYHIDQNPRVLKDRACVQGLVALTPVTEQSGGLCVISGTHHKFQEMGQRVEINWNHHFVVIPPGDPVLKDAGKILLCEPGDLCLWDSRTVHCNSPGRPLEEKEGKSEAVCVAQPTDAAAASNAMKNALEPDVKQAPKVPAGLSYVEKQKLKRDQDLEQKRAAYDAKLAQKKQWELLRLVAYVCMTPKTFATKEVIKQRQQAVAETQGTSHWPQFFIPSGRTQPPFESNPYIDQTLVVGTSRKGSCSLM